MKKKRRQIDKRLKKKLPPAGHRVKKCEGGVEIQLRGLHCRASYAVITPICHDDGDDDDDLDDYDLDDYDGDDDDDGDDLSCRLHCHHTNLMMMIMVVLLIMMMIMMMMMVMMVMMMMVVM